MFLNTVAQGCGFFPYKKCNEMHKCCRQNFEFYSLKNVAFFEFFIFFAVKAVKNFESP